MNLETIKELGKCLDRAVEEYVKETLKARISSTAWEDPRSTDHHTVIQDIKREIEENSPELYDQSIAGHSVFSFVSKLARISTLTPP